MKILNSANSKSSSVRIVPPYPLWRQLKVKQREDGAEIIPFLENRFPYVVADKWKQRIANGWVQVGGEPVSASYRLAWKDIIYHYNPAVKEPAVPDELRIVQESDNWLVVWKPAPMPMHQGGRYYKNTALHILYEMGYKDVKIVHRLDSVTSGLVLFARNRKEAAELQKALSSGESFKRYHALVDGILDEKIEIDRPIKRKRGFVFECNSDGKPALTLIEPVKQFENRTLVRCTPKTGRTHQIRLHLREAGHPIVDDPIYGKDGDRSGTRLQNCAISLVSTAIEIPGAGIKTDLESDPEWFDRPLPVAVRWLPGT